MLHCDEERRTLPPDPHPCDQVCNLLLVLIDTMEYADMALLFPPLQLSTRPTPPTQSVSHNFGSYYVQMCC